MANAAVATDVAQAGDVLCRLPTKLAFDDVVFVQERGQTRDFVFRQITRTSLWRDACLMAQLPRDARANAVQVRQRDDGRPVVRNINTQ